MPPYETRILDPSEYDDTELGSEVRAAWAEGVRVIELVEPRTLVRPEPLAMASSRHMGVTLYVCSECNGTSSAEAWQVAWWQERTRRMADREFDADDHGPDFGLDERMVCPRCKYVHSDDDCSSVDEIDGVAVPVA